MDKKPRKKTLKQKCPVEKRVTYPELDFDLFSSTDSSTDWEDVLERKIEDLSRQLTNEKQQHRKEKQQVAKLQRELARTKSESEKILAAPRVKEFEEERMLRLEAEQKLRDMTMESKNCQARLQSLQGEFKKMEEMVKNMMQCKSKIEQLKQEKSSLSVTYENNLLKYRSHISNLERENMMLLNDVKRFETQMDGKTDERSKLLLERLKMLEAENSSLVLENEQQRQQYEKCLDEIANQVVQALLAQKTLREECVKLQKRVNDLEYQNQELSHMYQSKAHYSTQSLCQSSSQNLSTSTLCEPSSHCNSVTSLPAQISTAISLTQTMHLSPMSQYILQNTVAQKCLQHLIPDSTDTLHNISDNTCTDNSDPRPRSISTSSSVPSSNNEDHYTKIETEFPATPSSPKIKHVSIADRIKSKRSSSVSSLQCPNKTPKSKSASSLVKSKVSQPIQNVQSKSVVNVTNQKAFSASNQQMDVINKKSASQPENIYRVNSGSAISGNNKQSSSKLVKINSNLPPKSAQNKTSIPIKRTSKPSLPQSSTPSPRLTKQISKQDVKDSGTFGKNSGSISSAKSHVSSSFKTDFVSQPVYPKSSANSELPSHSTKDKIDTIKESVPLLPKAQYFYDYSDEDSDINRPVSADFSTTSTVSLNELLEDDDTDTLLDEDFTAETFAFFKSPCFAKTEKIYDDSKKIINERQHRRDKTSSLGSKPDIVKDTLNCDVKSYSKSPHCRRRSLQSQGKRKYQNQRPSSLILNPNEKQFLYHGYSTSSISSTDSDETWSPQMERKFRPHPKAKRKSSSSSNRSSCHSSSIGDRHSLKSSQELTPVASELPKLPTSASSEMLNKDKIEQECLRSESIESVNSIMTKKGPPPPVPKKPMCGKKSPGIRMGLQSPGFRQNKMSIPNVSKDSITVPKPHEFKMDITTSTDCTPQYFVTKSETAEISKLTSKYVASSDSSFEGSKGDKVERSGSKDDGYSTMSSDIQPEMFEKFNESAQNNSDSINRIKVVLKDTVISSSPSECERSSKSSPGSEGDSMIGHASSEDHTSTSSLSSPQCVSSPSPHSPAYGSLGRVKAMKLLFESETQKTNDNKMFRFPLRKSPSVDSTLGSKTSKISVCEKRRSLGDEIFLNNTPSDSNENDRHVVEVKAEIHVSPVPVKSAVTNTAETITPPPKQIFKPVIPETQPSFHPLHFSEENFLSDIPEEKDELDLSVNSSASRLDCISKYHQPLIKHLEHLHMFKERKSKNINWSAIGIYRTSSDSDICKRFKSKADKGTDKAYNGRRPSRPLERSVSLTEIHKHAEVRIKTPRIPWNRPKLVLDEIKIEERLNEIMKSHILQQLSYSANQESDHDLESLSYSQILANRQMKDQKYQKLMELASAYDFHSVSQHSQISSLNQQGHRHVFHTEAHFCFNSKHANGKEFSHGLPGEDRLIRQGTPSSDSSCQEVDSKFRSDYYSLCMVGSKGSLFSGSNDGDHEHLNGDPVPPHTCKESNDKKNCQRCISAKNTEEFDEISRQLASLSKTVNALRQSLSSLNSHDSDTESNEDQVQLFSTTAENFRDNDGYQWVEDEFYLTPCGGEIILGTSPFSETGACADWINEYMDDTSCNDEFEYYGNLPPAHPDGKFNYKNVSDSILEDDGNPVTNGGNGEEQVAQGAIHDLEQRKVQVRDPKLQTTILESMVNLSGGSMDSLDDNIGVDHVMCSRLIGRGEKDHGPVRPTQSNRSAVDLSQFFTRFGESEQEAVAAFDFLNEIPTSPNKAEKRITPTPAKTENKATESVQMSKQITDCARKELTTTESKIPSSKKSQENTGKKEDVSKSANKGKTTPQTPASRFRMFRKQSSQGSEDADTSKRPAQGSDSSNSNMTSEKCAKNNVKEEKKILSKLPRKLIPSKNKTTKSKVESKIPKAAK